MWRFTRAIWWRATARGPRCGCRAATVWATNPRSTAAGRIVREVGLLWATDRFALRAARQRRRARPVAKWADYQWCQSGHNGEHQAEKVAWMWDRLPGKGVANGEPTYENMGWAGNGAGWWQGHEAWRNLCAGGTMGVVYGAGSLWQWRDSLDEPDQEWAHAAGATWRDALQFPGAAHVGRVNQLLKGLPLDAATPNRSATYGRPALLAPDRFFVCYLQDGGTTAIRDERVPRAWSAYDAEFGRSFGERRVARGRRARFSGRAAKESRLS